MHNAMTIYFDGEKYAGLLLAAVAAVIIAIAVMLYRAGADLRTFAVALSILALMEIALGVGLYVRTGPQVNRLAAQLDSDAAGFHAAESERMRRVQRNFVIVEAVELAVIIVAALSAFVLRGRPGVNGVMLGLLLHAAFLLSFDILAERRGAAYLAAIESTR